MKKIFLRPSIFWLALYSLTLLICEYFYLSYHITASPPFRLLTLFAYPVLLVWWIREKFPNDRNPPWGACAYFFLLLWPVLLPPYLFRRRGFRGILEYLLVLILAFLPSLAPMFLLTDEFPF